MCATLGYERSEEKDHDLRLKTLAAHDPIQVRALAGCERALVGITESLDVQ